MFYLLNLPFGCRRRCSAGGNGIAAQSQPPSLLVLCPVSAAHRIHARGIISGFSASVIAALSFLFNQRLYSDVSYSYFQLQISKKNSFQIRSAGEI